MKENKWLIYGHRKSPEGLTNKLEYWSWRKENVHEDIMTFKLKTLTETQQNGKLEDQRNSPTGNT